MKIDIDCVCETFVELMDLPAENLKDKELIFCEEHNKIYQWNASAKKWNPYPSDVEPVKEKTFEEQMDEYLTEKGLIFTNKGIAILRKDKTPAISIFLDENEESKLVFYNKQGMAVGVLNQSIFE